MKFLIYGINFTPELTGIGKYTGEMANWLVDYGHDVCVVTAPPYYPNWKLGFGYFNRWVKEDRLPVESAVATAHPLTVYRCPLWVPSHPGGIKRLLHLASFALSSLPVMLRQVLWRPDVVWVVEPALFCAPTALLVAKLSGARSWLHIQDYEVDAAFDLGLLKGPWLKEKVLGAERWLMRRFDMVSTISQRMLARAKAKGVAPGKLVMFPNWVDVSSLDSGGATQNNFRSQLCISADKVVALYSGNMGAKQGLELLADVAMLFAQGEVESAGAEATRQMMFVFCGNGAGRADLVARCLGLPNVCFMDLQPVERLGELLAMADIHLLPQRADAADLVMPSKLTGMLASGKPVVATALPGTELAAVVQGCGLVVPPADASAFARALCTLALDEPLRGRLGAAGLSYAKTYLDRDAVLQKFEADLLALFQK